MCGHQQRLDDGMGGLVCERCEAHAGGRGRTISCAELLVVIIFLMCLLHPRHCLKSFVISFHSHNSMDTVITAMF